jgi:hypothetical protein
LAFDPRYVEEALERIGEDEPDGEDLLRSEWEEGDLGLTREIFKAEYEVLTRQSAGL